MSTVENHHDKGIGYKLKLVQHTLRIAFDKALQSLELTTPQYAALQAIALDPGISSASLARSSFVTPQTMHGIISNLERNGLIVRTKDPQHGRILQTKLTKHGTNTIKKARKAIKKVETTMTKTISLKNLQLLERIFSECIDNLISNQQV